MNNLQVGKYENTFVGTISWPFIRYEALIPEQVKGDLFVWLFLSLVVYLNESNGRSSNTYNEVIKQEAKNLLTDRFGKIVDQQILEKIVDNAERGYLDFYNGIHSLKIETFSFLQTYEELFSDKLQMKHIYQDGVTGDVTPMFDDDLYLSNKEASNTDFKIDLTTKLKKPTKGAIHDAYTNYLLIKKGQQIPKELESSQIEDETPFDEFDDEEKSIFFDTLDDDFPVSNDMRENKKKSRLNFRNYSVRYYSDSSAIFNLKVELFIENNSIMAISPFGKSTDQWINRTMTKARNINGAFDQYLKEIESQFLVKHDPNNVKSYFGYKDEISDQLKHCSDLFRLMLSTKNSEAIKQVLIINDYFESKQKYFFLEIGKLLEYSIVPIREKTGRSMQNMGKTLFVANISFRLTPRNIDYKRLTTDEIYNNWKKGWTHFKADIAAIILETKISESAIIYPEFINDLFELYDLRNAYSHAQKRNSSEIKPSKEHLTKLLKVMKVIVDIY